MKAVLIVEDEEQIAALLCELLEDEGYRAQRAENGREALDLLAQSRPDLIISDLMMPVMDGWAFLRALRGEPEYQRIPVIILSAVHASAIPQNLSHTVVIRKPFRLDHVASTVGQLLNG